jgi:hypothetical protein
VCKPQMQERAPSQVQLHPIKNDVVRRKNLQYITPYLTAPYADRLI